MGDRLYPPQPWIHEASCQDTPRELPTFKARELPTAHPYGRPHICVARDTVTFNRDCGGEVVDYEPHPYRYSTIRPPGRCAAPVGAATRSPPLKPADGTEPTSSRSTHT